MKALLDTHVFLWWITDDPRLSPRAREIIADGANVLFLSAASGWEIAIKTKLGRLRLPDKPERFILKQLESNAIEVLPVQMSRSRPVKWCKKGSFWSSSYPVSTSSTASTGFSCSSCAP